jgi:hypothetical protein
LLVELPIQAQQTTRSGSLLIGRRIHATSSAGKDGGGGMNAGAVQRAAGS